MEGNEVRAQGSYLIIVKKIIYLFFNINKEDLEFI